MKYLRRYIRELLQEDLAGFLNDIIPIQANASSHGVLNNKFDRKQLKKAWKNQRDKSFIESLNTVHWAEEIGSIINLKNKNKSELSCKMYLPDEDFVPYYQHGGSTGGFGLWVKGWVTYATNDQNCLYSGFYDDYHPPEDMRYMSRRQAKRWTEENLAKYKHQKSSSGINKMPLYFPMKPNCPMLDASSFIDDNPDQNEALVDNWKPEAIVIRTNEGEKWTKWRLSDAVPIATEWNIRIVNFQKETIWSPED